MSPEWRTPIISNSPIILILFKNLTLFYLVLNAATMVAEILLNDGHPFGLCPNHSSAAQPCMILDWDVATIFAIKICMSIQTLMGGVPL